MGGSVAYIHPARTLAARLLPHEVELRAAAATYPHCSTTRQLLALRLYVHAPPSRAMLDHVVCPSSLFNRSTMRLTRSTAPVASLLGCARGSDGLGCGGTRKKISWRAFVSAEMAERVRRTSGGMPCSAPTASTSNKAERCGICARLVDPAAPPKAAPTAVHATSCTPCQRAASLPPLKPADTRPHL